MKLRHLVFPIVLFALASFPAGAKPTPYDFEEALGHAGEGNRALERGKLGRAERAFEAALRLVPELPQARLGLGHIAMARGRFERALAEYRRAESGYAAIAELAADMEAERWSRTRLSLMELDDYLRSGGPTNRIVASKTENLVLNVEGRRAPTRPDEVAVPPEIHFHLGNASYALGRVGEAVEQWERCARERPDIAELQYNLAIGYATLGRPSAALSALKRAEARGFDVPTTVRERIEDAAKPGR